MRIEAIRAGAFAALLLAALFDAAAASEGRSVRGRVVDEKGEPVAGASIGHYWRANGSGRDETGKLLELSTFENQIEFWGEVRIEDFKGKWVLLDFWGPSCRACMKTGMPKLIEFYEQHRRQREQFEILSICIDFEGEIKSMADLDRTLAPIVEHAWGGKQIPFPILLDPTFKTWERYGLPGLGTVLLVDPEGKLVKGDETDLAKMLK